MTATSGSVGRVGGREERGKGGRKGGRGGGRGRERR